MTTLTLPTPDMAKTPKRPAKVDDNPPTGPYFLLRLPSEYWPILKALSRKGSRSMTAEAQISIERRAAAKGIPFKPQHAADA